MSAERQMEGSTVHTTQDGIGAGLAALQAQMKSMEVRMDERFEGLAELIDAKLSPVREMTIEQKLIMSDHGHRLTRLETVMEREVAPVVEQMWKTRRDVQALQGQARRCDERSKASTSWWWSLIEKLVVAISSVVIGWIGALIWAGLKGR